MKRRSADIDDDGKMQPPSCLHNRFSVLTLLITDEAVRAENNCLKILQIAALKLRHIEVATGARRTDHGAFAVGCDEHRNRARGALRIELHPVATHFKQDVVDERSTTELI